MARRRETLGRTLGRPALLALATMLAACHGCRTTPTSSTALARGGPPPTVRLYVVSNLAGALEPCGCTQDQLGGLDHLAAYIATERPNAPASALVAAGPTLFLDVKLDPVRAAQNTWKAEAIATGLGGLELAAWTPGANDWAAGAEALARLAGLAHTAPLAANLSGATAGAVRTAIRVVGGVSVGFAGVGAFDVDGVTTSPAPAALRAAVDDLARRGAKILVGLASVPRGEAMHLVDTVPELNLLVVGKAADIGEANDAPAAPRLIGSTLVVEPSNHLQTVGVVDFFVRDGGFAFHDGSNVSAIDHLASLDKRIADLETRVASWERAGLAAADVAARRADLAKMRAERAALAEPKPPAAGSFFRYHLEPVRVAQGTDAATHATMVAYYRRVNDHNRVALAGREPPKVPAGASTYVGVEVCTTCHAAERRVWDRTPHARAYATLATQFKEFNLECVSCHVTGYEQPGGSTVTTNDKLRDVQCEQCHGPGSAHVDDPERPGLVVASPRPEMCASSCHHPPHVEGFDPVARRERILGPGHGLADDAPTPAWMRESPAPH